MSEHSNVISDPSDAKREPSGLISEPLLQVRALGAAFGPVRVLEDVSFDLHPGETLGLVGESGSGKSTLARVILRLIPAARGEVSWRGHNLLSCSAAQMRAHRRELQMVFQDPLASLDPRMTVGEILAEPLKIFEAGLSAGARRLRIDAMLTRVGLVTGMAGRYPHEFSGGQCQRIGIARAMMLNPKLLICDEPVSSLDVSIQGQIVNLLIDLQREFGMAMLFISHNLAVVRHLSHRVLVMYRGRLVEIAPRDALFAAPLHPYTRALLGAVPSLIPARRTVSAPSIEQAPPTSIETPSSLAAAAGCVFRERCPHAIPLCETTAPPLEEITGQHWAACHLYRSLSDS
jgi:oligopeptide transport system ATP-binding protein